MPDAGDRPQDRIVAIIDNQPVSTEELAPVLFELAGREALREVALDRLLARELNRRGMVISEEQIEHEHRLFEARLAEAASSDATAPVREQVWRARALGPQRRQALFRRNAALRALIADRITVSEPEIDLAMELAYGPKKIARLILLENERDAAEVRSMLGDRPSVEDVARAAERHSIDPTASRSGRLPPVHLSDPAYPIAVRHALESLNPGSLSPILPLPEGAALVYLEGAQPRTQPPPDARRRLAEELRIQRERLEMDRLARSLVAGARIQPLDHSLGWAWER